MNVKDGELHAISMKLFGSWGALLQMNAIADRVEETFTPKEDREFIELNAATFLKAKKKAVKNGAP